MASLFDDINYSQPLYPIFGVIAGGGTVSGKKVLSEYPCRQTELEAFQEGGNKAGEDWRKNLKVEVTAF